jgi:hypothetical protein
MRRNRELLLDIYAHGLYSSCSEWRRHFQFSAGRHWLRWQRRIVCGLWLRRIIRIGERQRGNWRFWQRFVNRCARIRRRRPEPTFWNKPVLWRFSR